MKNCRLVLSLKILLLSCLVHSWGTVFSQCASDKKLASLLENAILHAENYPVEKVYLHFDNNSYFLGETLWYKAYVLTNGRLESSISKVLHVEIWSQYGQKIDEQLLQLKDGVACGQFELDRKNLPGYYEVRAYTRWMRNFGDINYFSRVFPFYMSPSVSGDYKKELFNFNVHKSMKVRPSVQHESVEIDFLPEGGRLVQKLPSLLVFRVRAPEDPYPSGLLKIYSEKNRLLDTCSVIHDGMGCFQYVPEDKPGYVVLTYKKKDYKFTLPVASSEGVSLAIDTVEADSITITCRRSDIGKMDTLALCLASNGRPYNAVNLMTNEKEVRLKMPLANMPCGVAQAILLASSGETLCERMFFVNRMEKYINISVSDTGKVYTPGEYVELRFKVAADTLPISTTFSLAVRSVVNSDISQKVDNARANLLLSSELRGYIHNPEYYFLPNGNVRKKELDLLMLVHGWKKYDWRSLTSSSSHDKPIFLPEVSLLLEGRLKSSWTRKYLPNASVSIMIRDSIMSSAEVFTDSVGYFSFPLDEFSGRVEAILQSRSGKGNKKKQRCYFLFDRHSTPSLRSYEQKEVMPLWWQMSIGDSLKIVRQELANYQNDGGIILDEVLIKKRRSAYPLLEYDRSVFAFYNVAQMVEDDLDRGKKYVSLTDFLQKQSVLFREKKEKNGMPSWAYNGMPFYTVVNGELLLNRTFVMQALSEVEGIKSVFFCVGSSGDKFLVNALMNTDRNSVGATHSKNWEEESEDVVTVEKIYVDENTSYNRFKDLGTVRDLTPFDIASRGSNVMMVIETQPGVDIHLSHKVARGLRSTYIRGYEKAKSFYSPDYSKVKLPLENDHRRTLYWNPNVVTNECGEANVSFYNAKEYTFYNINAEGVTRDGRVGVLNK